MAAPTAWRVYDTFKLYQGNGTIDLDTDTFKCALFQSTSNAATLTNSTYANLTNEVAQANGYTTGGVTLSTVSWTNSSGTSTWDFSTDPSWTASGGAITARFAAIYKSGTANSITNPLVAYCLLDSAPADVSANAGQTLTITLSASGIFTIGGGTT